MEEYSIAPFYDLLLYPFVAKLRHRLLDICRENNYSKILDVCCGTGDQLKLLQKHGFEAHGVDLSEKMLQVSRKGPYKPICRFEDATSMSYPDHSFPMAMTTFALHEKPRPVSRAIIEEMIRVVEPGGDLLLVDYRFTEESSVFSTSVIRFIERGAGGEHFQNFKDFLRYGGIPELVKDLPLEFISLTESGMGSLGIFLYKNRSHT